MHSKLIYFQQTLWLHKVKAVMSTKGNYEWQVIAVMPMDQTLDHLFIVAIIPYQGPSQPGT